MIAGPDSTLLVSRVNPIFTESRFSLPLVEANTARQLGLMDAQVVQALVQARGDQLGLLLRGRLLEVAMASDWEAGQSLSFRVQANPNGSMTLHPIPGAAPATAAAPAPAQPVISRLENLLFHPSEAPDLRALFKPGVLDALLSRLMRPDLQAQWQAMRPSIAQISPEAIRLALVAAMGSEAALARGQLPPVQDPKQVLHKLLLALGQGERISEQDRDTCGQLQRALDELESAQVHAVQSQSQDSIMFNMVLPFKDAEPVEISFQGKRALPGQPELLTVNIHSNSPDYGELWLKTEVHDRSTVELVMWAARADVVEQAGQGAQALGLELQQAGLSMRSFQVIHGARPAPEPEPMPASCGVILDLRA
ncbi:MAG: hypothetical protein WCJ76_11090 [Comamonadaceae bacterium]